jgi:hypothetical protein
MTSYKKRNYKNKKGKKGRKTRKMQMKEVYLRKKGGIQKGRGREYLNIGKGNPWKQDPTLKQLIECEEYIIFIDNPGPKNDYTYGVEPGIGKHIMNQKLFKNIIDSLSREDDKKSVHKHFGIHRIFMILKDDTGYCCRIKSKKSEEKTYENDNKGEKKSYKGGSEQEFENDREEVDVAEAKGSENPKTEEEEAIKGGYAVASCNMEYLNCNEDEPIAEWIKDLHACKEREFIGKLYDTTDGKSEQKLIDTRLSDINSLKNVMCLKTVYYR